MKNIKLLVATLGIMILNSCTGPDGPPGIPGRDGTALESASFEISKRDFVAPKFETFYDFPKPILNDDHVLVYRRIGTDIAGKDVWNAVPEFHFLPNGTLDYAFNFDFSVNNVRIYLTGGNLGALVNTIRLQQIFRIVSVPGYAANRGSNAAVNLKDYYAVIKYYNIDDSKIQTIRN